MWAAAVASLCCRAKIAVPVMIAVASVFTLYVLNWMAEFQPTISDTLTFTNHHATVLYAIIVPPGNAYDFEAQMEPLDVVLDTVYSSIHGVPLSRRSNTNNNNNMPEDQEDDSEIPMPPSSVLLSDTGDTTLTEAPEVYRRFYDMTLAAAETFAMNASDTTTTIASPIQCSFQLYHLLYDSEGQPLPPEEHDMWTARGVLVHAPEFADVQHVVQEMNNMGDQHTTAFPPLQAINFGPGPFAHGSHPIVSDSIVVSVLETYWVETLISVHWDTFGEQDKFVVLRLEVVTESTMSDPTAEGPDIVAMYQHIIMKSDSLDTYELIYPNNNK